MWTAVTGWERRSESSGCVARGADGWRTVGRFTRGEGAARHARVCAHPRELSHDDAVHANVLAPAHGAYDMALNGR